MTICGRKACANEGTVHPVLLLYPSDMPDYDGPPAEVILSLAVCPEHQAKTKVLDLVGDEQWEFLRGIFLGSGHAEPDRSRLALDWRPVDSIDFNDPKAPPHTKVVRGDFAINNKPVH